jgi:lantibiotic modifying enzyme
MITLPSTEAEAGPWAAGPVARPTATLGRDDVLPLVADIAASLHARALWHEGRALWLGDQVEPMGSDYRVIHRACGGDLYDGTAGIGWFLAQAAAVTGDADARRDALGAFRHALDSVTADGPPGLHDGASGIGWAVLDGGLALGHPIATEGLAVLLDATHRSAGMRLPDEVIAGRAGVILAALAGAELAHDRLDRTEAARLLTDAAIELGRQVLASARRAPNGWTWQNAFGAEDEPSLCGLGHGGSGPILACAHLAAVTGDPGFIEGATQGARGERAWLRVDEGWPDLRGFDRAALERGDRPGSPVLWCHGAGGIGLTRIRAARLLDDQALLADATIALQLAAREVPRLWHTPPGTYESNWSLCHGAAGLIELFCAAARELGDGAWLAAAAAVVETGIAQREAGFGWTCGIRGGTESASLMLGLAGTGAALLRLAAPDGIASPLTIGPAPRGARLTE